MQLLNFTTKSRLYCDAQIWPTNKIMGAVQKGLRPGVNFADIFADIFVQAIINVMSNEVITINAYQICFASVYIIT